MGAQGPAVGHSTKRLIAIALVALLAMAGVAYAWDEARSDEIAEGVRVGSVDVGGLDEDEARTLLQRELVEPVRGPVTATYRGEQFEVGAGELGLHADVDGMVDAAIDAGRDGWLGGRVWRYATGGDIEKRIAPRVSFSEDAIADFVARVEGAVNQEPKDATVAATPTSLQTVAAESGVAVRHDELRAAVEDAVKSPGDRTVEVPVERVEPEVTEKELPDAYPVYMTVDRGSFTLRLYKRLELAKTYTIAVGALGYDTPVGLYHIQNKAIDPAWHVPDSEWAGRLAGRVIPGGAPNNPLKARWLGIYDGAGIHGTDDIGSLGSAASHGCIRMAVSDVIDLYDQVPVGAPIYIG
jgi:lipoprotein-anchoring transpeptidase ErfK/SrfK